MKIALAQLNYHIGNFESNVLKIKKAIAKAKKEKADLVVFAELSLCGYPPRDFLEFNDFIRHCESAVRSIAAECRGIAAIVGAPSVNPQKEGKNLFNSAYFLSEGKIISIHNKALLPNYDVFDEYRYFEPAKKLNIIKYKNVKIALTICEDIWDIGDDLMYTYWPMEELARQKPDIMINIAASPFDYAHAEMRKKVMSANTKKYKIPLFYVNHVGSQTELIFDGGSMVSDGNGNIVDEMKYFEEEIKYFTFQGKNLKLKKNNVRTKPGLPDLKYQRIHDALILGIRDYFKKMNFQKAIIGLSGGIDSAVVLVLAAKALGKENVKALLMPSQFSSEHSVTDSKQLAENIGCPYEIISIKNSYENILKTLDPFFKGLPFNITEENLQARIRAILLMAFTNKFGYILLNTSNKSELAVGYGTLYGDMCGGLSVLGDVYKTEVYKLAEYINKEGNKPERKKYSELIPGNIIDKPPSAELRPDQKDIDTLPDYAILDNILFQYIELRKSPDEIIASGSDKKLVKRILQMVNTNEYKRYQTPPVLRISPKAFGMGRRMPIVGKYL